MAKKKINVVLKFFLCQGIPKEKYNPKSDVADIKKW